MNPVVLAAAERNATPHCGEAPVGASLLDLLSRLLDDHQRMEPHHEHLCELCKSTAAAIEVAARSYSETERYA